ncbi:MAG: hypothetical protein AAF928_08220 [Myxococcota bacterium]
MADFRARFRDLRARLDGTCDVEAPTRNQRPRNPDGLNDGASVVLLEQRWRCPRLASRRSPPVPSVLISATLSFHAEHHPGVVLKTAVETAPRPVADLDGLPSERGGRGGAREK